MRIHGTLTKWNDDRGFGFITPAKGPPDVFVHISAFPRDGVRPQLNELISFEVEPGKDGKSRAVRIMRPGQKAARPRPVVTSRAREPMRWKESVIAVLLVAGLGSFGWSKLTERAEPAMDASPLARIERPEPVSRYACDGRKRCEQMTTCEEAYWFLRNCPGMEMDGDGDGEPCESRCN